MVTIQDIERQRAEVEKDLKNDTGSSARQRRDALKQYDRAKQLLKQGKRSAAEKILRDIQKKSIFGGRKRIERSTENYSPNKEVIITQKETRQESIAPPPNLLRNEIPSTTQKKALTAQRNNNEQEYTFLEKRALAVQERAKKDTERQSKVRKILGTDKFLSQEDDSKVTRFAKAGIRVITELPFLGNNIAMATDKAVLQAQFRLFGNEEQKEEAKLLKRGYQADAAVYAISPFAPDKKTGKYSFNPEGSANVVTAGVFAGVKATVQTKATAQRGGTPETTGKISDLSIKSRSTQGIQTTGTVTKNTPLPKPQTSTLTTYKAQPRGVINRVLGRKIDTSIKQSPSGKVVKTEVIGKYKYQTTQQPQQTSATVSIYKNGRLIKTNTIKEAQILQPLEAPPPLLDKKQTTSSQRLSKSSITQKKDTIKTYGIDQKISKKQSVEGTLLDQTTIKSTSRSGVQNTVIGNVKSTVQKSASGSKQSSSYTKTGQNIQESQLNIGKGKPQPSLISTNTKPKGTGVTINQNSISASVVSQSSLTRTPQTFTNYRYSRVVTSDLRIKSNPPVKPIVGKKAQVGQISSSTVVTETPRLQSIEAGGRLPQLPIVENSKGSVPLVGVYSPESAVSPKIETRKATASIQRNDPIVKPTQKIRPQAIVNPLEEQRQDTPLKQTPIVDTTPKRKTKNTPIQDTTPIQDIITKAPTKQPPIVDTPRQQTPRQTPPSFFFPPKTLLPVLTGSFRPPQNVERQTEQGYLVAIRKGGVFRTIKNKVFSKQDAFNYGSYQVQNSPQASFKPIKSNQKPNTSFSIKSFIPNLIRKDGVFIEPKNQRINTQGELSGITRKGQQARKARGVNIWGFSKK